MTVLAAVDGDRDDDPVVSVAHELATAAEEELVVLHVMPERQFEEIRESTGERSVRFVAGDSGIAYTEEDFGGSYNLEDATDDAAAVAEGVIESTLGAPGNVRAEGRVGDPAEEIIAEADRVDASYVAIGGRKRSPVGKAVFGSVTQSVLLDADAPVLTVMGED